MKLCLLILLILPIANIGRAQNVLLPAMQLTRAEEDYSALKQTELKGVNRLKYLSLGHQAYISFGGEVRYMAEYFENNGWDDDGDSFWLLQRYLLHADIHLGSFRLFVQPHSCWQILTVQEPRAVDEDRLDFHQLFAEYTIMPTPELNIRIRAGRQEFKLGSQRLISLREGPNVRLSFDAINLMAEHTRLRTDLILARRVVNQPGIWDNTSTNDESFWGMYQVFNSGWKNLMVDVYYLGYLNRNKQYEEGRGRELRHSLGIRLWKEGPISINTEAVYQWGTFQQGPIEAYTLSVDASAKTELPTQPILGLRTELISGDRTTEDGRLQTFNALYPRGAYFGLISLIGPSNLMDVHPLVTWNLRNSLSITFDWDFFWRYSRQDGVYGPNIALERSGISSSTKYLGHQPGFELALDQGRFWSFSLEGSWFKPSQFFEDTGSRKDVLHFAITSRYKF
ncbi:alginate export family protein [Catalinimonas niigatensis]|uniref:alginate export family protein n=1 Tax=Catalinimonas niigatensis TaxID=1397264 RepID=UPI002665437F|nr:alginate export family protein [Catalinimonas niigatensis]WPP48730.1 alginate export family protein [Catalinimonas niigatensis]